MKNHYLECQNLGHSCGEAALINEDISLSERYFSVPYPFTTAVGVVSTRQDTLDHLIKGLT
jgi:hypothetical protein